jgi:hypothetical protein
MSARKKVNPKARTERRFAFTLWLRGPDVLSNKNLNALYEAGCSDATFGAQGSEYYAAFERPSSAYSLAVISAIRDIQKGVPGIRVLRVDVDRAPQREATSAINSVLNLKRYVRSNASNAEKRAIAGLAEEDIKGLVTAR